MKLNSIGLVLELLPTVNAMPVTNSTRYHIHKLLIDPIIHAIIQIRWAIYPVKENEHETE